MGGLANRRAADETGWVHGNRTTLSASELLPAATAVAPAPARKPNQAPSSTAASPLSRPRTPQPIPSSRSPYSVNRNLHLSKQIKYESILLCGSNSAIPPNTDCASVLIRKGCRNDQSKQGGLV